MQEVLRKASTPLVALLLAVLAFVAYTNVASATHEPAMKAAAAGSDIDEVSDATPILSETMRVSSQEDVIINVSAECSILTSLTTNNDGMNARAFGSVRLWVEIDGRRVPVAVDDTAVDNDDQEDTDPDTGESVDESDIGEVTFCNRAYERTVADEETPTDGVDEESDYIDTRTANSFQWLALDTGFVYDDPTNGNNVLTVRLWADYDTSTVGQAAAEAFVGSRTMIIEPVKVSIHEQVEEQGGAGS